MSVRGSFQVFPALYDMAQSGEAICLGNRQNICEGSRSGGSAINASGPLPRDRLELSEHSFSAADIEVARLFNS